MPANRGKGGRPTNRPGLKVIRRAGSSSLYIVGSVKGTRVRETAGTDDPALAEEARAAREAELYRAAVYGAREAVTFVDATISYIENGEHSRSTLKNVERISQYLGKDLITGKIDQNVVDRAARALCPGSSPATVHRQIITPVKAILNHAARRGWCDPPRFERVKPAGKRTDWLTPAEGEALIAAASDLMRPLLIFLLGTGARVGEAVALSWEDVDLQHGRATLRQTKNGDDRILDLCPRVVANMALITGDRTGAVFRYHGEKTYRKTASATQVAYGGQISKAFATALRRAGISRKITPHHLRHTWATWHYAAHRDLMRLRDDGGWRTVAMCERYAKLAPAGTAAELSESWDKGFDIRRKSEVA